ncbi:hypothetical protein nbrc107697_15440 [Gordonia crocea]|uniref:Acetyltransferase n=1 Tax=Gordonia crocea TaxID=589162 RepID=A0A7I9UWJ3_9ACTN|nr:hypothetical protein nbrc107697_15440 [Gordonia crocea]
MQVNVFAAGMVAVIARTEPDNTASRRVLEAAGFVRTPAADSVEHLAYRRSVGAVSPRPIR